MSSPSEPLPPAHTPASGCESPHPAKTVEESVLASPAEAQVPAQPQCEVTDGGDPPKVVGTADDTDDITDGNKKTQNGKKRKAKSPENFPSKKVRTGTENPKEYFLCVPSSETYRWDPEQIKKTTAKALELHPRWRWKMRFAKVVQREDGYYNFYPGKWAKTVVGDAALEEAIVKLGKEGLGLVQRNGFSYDIEPDFAHCHEYRRHYIHLQALLKEKGIHVSTAALDNVEATLEEDGEVYDHCHDQYIDSDWGEDHCTECGGEIDDDGCYCKPIRLAVPIENYEVDNTKVKEAVQQALNVQKWQSADGFEYIECSLVMAWDALIPLDLELEELQQKPYYKIVACDDDERYMLNPLVDEIDDMFED
jgi:hypothetical protein